MSSVKKSIEDIAAPIERNIQPAQEMLRTADTEVRKFVRDYPLAAAAGALALGLLLGRALARR